jgi:glycosyl hydrolase family 44
MPRIVFSALALALLGASHRPVPNLNPAVTINVDASANRRAIDPRIYGVAFAPDTATINDLSIPINRWGGNTTSRYNWIYSTANHAVDYFFENIPDNVVGDGSNGESADAFINLGSQAIITIPVMKYLPKARQKDCAYTSAKYGPEGCCSGYANTQFEPPDCGNGFSTAMGNPPLKGVNIPTDVETLYDPASPHQADWIQHMIDTHGTAATTGVKYYAIDNEPDLWDSTHFDIHPDPSTYDEIGNALLEFGPMIKTKDPNAKVLAPELSGWMWYFDSAYGWANGHNDQTNHGGVYFVPWLLQQAKAYEQAHGVRIMDVLSLHWYPQGKKVGNGPITNNEFDPNNPADEVTTDTKLLRNQSTRSLWDPNYVDQSWIHDLGYENNEPHLIPLMREWVNTYYPGTQIAITEYNWGAENDPNGATAQAEILGIFGREGLDMATRWTSPDPASNVYQAYKMYRNYDGAHSFGDISVRAAQTDGDIDNVSAFAALRSSDGALTIMVMGKFLTDQTPVTINIANYIPSGAAKVFRLDAGNVITPQPDLPLAGSSLSFTANAQTVNLFVIPGSYLNPPASVNATPTSGSTAQVSWPAAAGALTYEVYRSTSINGPYTDLGPHASPFGDAGLGADTTYLYKIASVSGSAVSPMGNLDAATTTVFTNDPLSVGTTAVTAHITQLRTAVSAMRTAAALGPAAFTDTPLTSGTTIKALHITQLRTALDQARSALGLPPIAYTDATITPGVTPVKAAHITDLRNGVK